MGLPIIFPLVKHLANFVQRRQHCVWHRLMTGIELGTYISRVGCACTSPQLRTSCMGVLYPRVLHLFGFAARTPVSGRRFGRVFCPYYHIEVSISRHQRREGCIGRDPNSLNHSQCDSETPGEYSILLFEIGQSRQRATDNSQRLFVDCVSRYGVSSRWWSPEYL